MQLGADPKSLKAIDIFLYPDALIAVDILDAALAAKDASIILPQPVLHFTREDYPTHLDRLLELAEAQRVAKKDEEHVTLLSGFLKGQN